MLESFLRSNNSSNQNLSYLEFYILYSIARCCKEFWNWRSSIWQADLRNSQEVISWWLPTGKSLSEALLFAEHGENMLCLNVRNNFCTQHVLPRFELGFFMYWTSNSMNNLSPYCGLTDSRMSASGTDLPVPH